MKKIKNLLIIFIYLFIFFININVVDAASSADLQNLLLDSIPSNNKICVYATNDFKAKDMYNNPLRDEFKYLVIVFSKNGNSYEATDYTFAVKNSQIAKPSVILIPSVSGGSSTFSTNNCSDYYPYIQTMPTGDYSFYIADNTTKSATKYYYQYNKTATDTVTKNTSKLEEGSSLEKCSYTVGKTNVRLVSYVAGSSSRVQNNYFSTNLDSRLACPATTEITSNTISYYTRIKLDINSFDCNSWRLIENPFISTMDTDCYYYLVDKYQQTHDDKQEETNGVVVTRYLAYNNSKAETINIIKTTDGSYRAVFAKDNRYVAISNISQFTSDFASGKTQNYPTWINTIDNEDGSTSYQLSSTKSDTSRINYICQPKIFNVYGNIDSDPNETCLTLFGNDFLKFLNNNVFTIVRISIPLLLILFTTFDFAKVIFVDDKDGIQKAGKRFGKRLVAAILVFLIPQIIIWLANIIGADKVNECAEWMQNNQSEINNISDNK